jgi:hypothetical protein
MSEMMWRPIETAPKDGTPILLAYTMTSRDLHGYAVWSKIDVVIGWWEDDSYDHGWRICFMEDGAADSYGMSSQFFQTIPEAAVAHWMPMPPAPSPPDVEKMK